KVGVADIQCPGCHVLITKHYCSHCSELILDHSLVCPLCGKNDTERRLSYAPRPIAKIVVSAAVSVLFFLFIASVVPGHRAQMQNAAPSGSLASSSEVPNGPSQQPKSRKENVISTDQSAQTTEAVPLDATATT